MRLLVDANLSPKVAHRLTAAGQDAVHVVEIDLVSASGEAILARADADGRVVVSSDTSAHFLPGGRWHHRRSFSFGT